MTQPCECRKTRTPPLLSTAYSSTACDDIVPNDPQPPVPRGMSGLLCLAQHRTCCDASHYVLPRPYFSSSAIRSARRPGAYLLKAYLATVPVAAHVDLPMISQEPAKARNPQNEGRREGRREGREGMKATRGEAREPRQDTRHPPPASSPNTAIYRDTCTRVFEHC